MKIRQLMNSGGFARLLFALLLVAAFTERAAAIEFGLSLYGLSYHLDRRDETGYRFNERNPGFGVQSILASKDRSKYYVEAAILEDSYRRAAKYITFGYDYRLYKGLSLGVLCGIYDSRSVAETATVVAAPMISYRYRDLKVNLVHLPEFPGINPYPSFALYATLFVWHSGAASSK
jgi:hypothetical protein